MLEWASQADRGLPSSPVVLTTDASRNTTAASGSGHPRPDKILCPDKNLSTGQNPMSWTKSDVLDKIARLFKIVTLAASATEQEKLGRRALADACGCSLSTLNRDLALLAQAGIPIDYDRRRSRYHLPDTGWTFPVAALTPADALALALLQSLAATPGIPHGDALRRTLDKLAGSVPPALAALLGEAGAVVGWGTPTRDYSQSPLDFLQDAARARRTVELDYDSRSGSGRSFRAVDPYRVEARDGRFWELHGWCHRHQAIRTFALDQVRGVRGTDFPFSLRSKEWSAFLETRGVIGGLRGEDPIAVDVLFVPPVAAYARTHQWPVGLSLTPEADGAVRLSGTAAGVSGLVPELLRWRRFCHVLGGPALQAAMAEEVHAMAALYPESDAKK